MEDLDEITLDELKKKAIERGSDLEIEETVIDEVTPVDPVDPVDPVELEQEELPKKTKKKRSEKQILAFEKARLKRAENLKIKKQMEAEKKEQKKAQKEIVKKEVKERLESKDFGVEVLKDPPTVQEVARKVRFEEPPEDVRYREQVVNNYYYYSEPPPQKKKKKSKKKRPPTPPPTVESSSESEISSESEEDLPSPPAEPVSYKELQNFQEEVERNTSDKAPTPYKFRFA